MFHKIEIDRLFTLGDYKNVHVSVTSDAILDEEWNDREKMDQIRKEVVYEVLMNFALLQSITSENADAFINGYWLDIYDNLLRSRHVTSEIEVLDTVEL